MDARHKHGRIPSRRRIKKLLTKKLTYAPFLKLLIFKFWFRMAFLAFVGLAMFLGLFLPKMWRVTPAGFKPVIRISGLDRAQAFMLRRTAERAMAARRFAEAGTAWHMAFFNNPADSELARGTLLNVAAQDDVDLRHVVTIIRNGQWLLRLTQTNRADLTLMVGLCDRYRLYDVVDQLLQPRAASLAGALAAAYQKALFHQRRPEEFGERWGKLAPALQADPELNLYRAAHLTGWGTPEVAGPARAQLTAALTGPPALQATANRLLLTVNALQRDVPAYAQTLQHLQDLRADTLTDHIQYWRLLAGAGRKPEAVELAQLHVQPPRTATEVNHLANVYRLLELTEEARLLLARYAPQFNYVEDVWVAYGALLIELQRWDDLRAMALQLRQVDALRERLAAYSHYLEGRADLGQQRLEPARAAFARAAQVATDLTGFGLETAQQLLKLGHPEPARALLLRTEAAERAHPLFYVAAFEAAARTKDLELLRRAAAQQYAANPRNAFAINRYAASLLIGRDRADEAIKLTLQLVGNYPYSVAATLNHSLALLLNQRVAEAEALLDRIDPGGLAPPEATTYHLARFEAHLRQARHDLARHELGLIDRAHLFPVQETWLQECRARLPAPAPGGSH